MKIWLITDTHFGHDKIKTYCERPDNFEKTILKNLKKVLNHDDILIHLGDFCIGNDAKWHELFMSAVPCKKWLLLGNHDSKSSSWYLSHGWDFVGNSIQVSYFGKKILFSHTPLAIGENDLMIHGHFHNTLHRLLEKQWVSKEEEKRNEKDLQMLSSQHKLLAIEYTDYQPVLLEKFIKKLKEQA